MNDIKVNVCLSLNSDKHRTILLFDIIDEFIKIISKFADSIYINDGFSCLNNLI